ncbi:AMP-binding protein [Enhydrobacter sp.]|jgi:phenylacetate-CoA ligase|uniref:phenylacetate--CoA ligase family protein n=1 Tax=Enhydrobacter sp. TaxID=1894999 RepID=UPI00262037EF|nr:AMP-binding protein [Enhydrobacter sp.]WIM14048.1 MAG: Coenzyme A ligase [Enhydrobacter sp.]
MSGHYDTLETRKREEREAALMQALPGQIAHAKANAPFFAEWLKDVDPAAITSREALARLPVLRKSKLGEVQKADPPMGGLIAVPLAEARHVFMSPGPIFEIDTDEPDYFRGARAMYAAGFRRGDVVYNTFSYHLTPAGIMMESALRALGCPVVPGGIGNTELQLDAIAAIKPVGYAGTPSFLKILIEKGAESGKDVSSLKKAFVGAEALPPSLRRMFQDAGISCLQSYGTADVGTIAYESEAIEGMIVDEGVIVEIVRPGTGDPVPEGDVGEVVVTTFNRAYPLIRFGTGDMSAVLPGESPCGRTNMRIKGWMGRADQRTKVRGMFVDPEQIAEIARRHPGLGRLRLVIDWVNQADVMVLKAESADTSPALADALADTIRAVCKVGGKVEFFGHGTLPNDGKVIDDIRKYT